MSRMAGLTRRGVVRNGGGVASIDCVGQQRSCPVRLGRRRRLSDSAGGLAAYVDGGDRFGPSWSLLNSSSVMTGLVVVGQLRGKRGVRFGWFEGVVVGIGDWGGLRDGGGAVCEGDMEYTGCVEAKGFAISYHTVGLDGDRLVGPIDDFDGARAVGCGELKLYWPTGHPRYG